MWTAVSSKMQKLVKKTNTLYVSDIVAIHVTNCYTEAKTLYVLFTPDQMLMLFLKQRLHIGFYIQNCHNVLENVTEFVSVTEINLY